MGNVKFQPGDVVKLKTPYKPAHSEVGRPITTVVVDRMQKELKEKLTTQSNQENMADAMVKTFEAWEGYIHGIIVGDPRRRSDGVLIFTIVPYDHETRTVFTSNLMVAVTRAFEENELERCTL